MFTIIHRNTATLRSAFDIYEPKTLDSAIGYVFETAWEADDLTHAVTIIKDQQNRTVCLFSYYEDEGQFVLLAENVLTGEYVEYIQDENGKSHQIAHFSKY